MTSTFEDAEKYLNRLYDGFIYADTKLSAETLHTGDRHYSDLRHRIERSQIVLTAEQERNPVAMHYYGDAAILLNSGLAGLAGKNEVMHCANLMHLFFWHVNLKGEKFWDYGEKKIIGSIRDIDIEKYYQLPKPQVQMEEITNWANSREYDSNNLLINWLEYGNIVRREPNGSIPIGQFRAGVRMAMILMNRLCGDRYTTVVNEGYLPVLTYLIDLQLVPPLAELLKEKIKNKIQLIKNKKSKEFYMSSYIIDTLCLQSHSKYQIMGSICSRDPSVHVSKFFSKFHINKL